MLDSFVAARVVAGLVASTLWLLSAAAVAQSERDAPGRLAEGIAAYEEGRFEDARGHLDAAAGAGGLDRDGLIRWVSTRVLVAQGLGDDVALESALLQLVTLDPAGLGPNASPALARQTAAALEQTGGATVAIEVDHERTDAGLAVRARVRGDVGGLVRDLEVRARVTGGDWVDANAGEVVLPGAAAADVEVVAIARGPGGAPVATLGDDGSPHRLATPAPAAALAPADEPADDGGDDGALIGVLVAVGLAVVAGAVVLGVVLGTQGDPQTDLMGPVVEW